MEPQLPQAFLVSPRLEGMDTALLCWLCRHLSLGSGVPRYAPLGSALAKGMESSKGPESEGPEARNLRFSSFISRDVPSLMLMEVMCEGGPGSRKPPERLNEQGWVKLEATCLFVCFSDRLSLCSRGHFGTL